MIGESIEIFLSFTHLLNSKKSHCEKAAVTFKHLCKKTMYITIIHNTKTIVCDSKIFVVLSGTNKKSVSMASISIMSLVRFISVE